MLNICNWIPSVLLVIFILLIGEWIDKKKLKGNFFEYFLILMGLVILILLLIAVYYVDSHYPSHP